MLAAKIEGQMEKVHVQSNSVAHQELSATMGYVYATMQVHEALDNPRVHDNDNVFFFDYLRDLCERLKQLIRFPEGNYTYYMDENEVNIKAPYAEARTVGVILTELLINVDQHAYAYDSDNKWVDISIGRQNNYFFLRISDRGKGMSVFSDRPAHSASDGRGIQLISDMVRRQLEGTFDIDSGHNGTTVKVTIPVRVLESIEKK